MLTQFNSLSRRTALLGLLGIALVACQPITREAALQRSASPAASDAETTQNMAIVRRFYEEFSLGNADVILEVHLETLTMHFPGGVEDVPTQVLRDDLAAIKAANPDLRAEVHSMFGAGDIVVTELTWMATHTGDFFGIPATGKTALHNGVVARRLENGKIVESWEVFDDLGFLQSLGYLPSWEDIIAQGPMTE